MTVLRSWPEDPWDWAGGRLFALTSGLAKRWLSGALFGLVANCGVLGAALAAYALIAVGGWALGWNELEQTELWQNSAWVWVPIGWYVAGRELASAKRASALELFDIFPAKKSENSSRD